MALTPGTRLGVYDVIAQIGKGGMGQVYRARDTKLNRDVALKVLPDSFAYDSHLLARFTREARTLASLNHPHIAQIYGLEESGGVRALVMELVEGEDLSRRIARGAIPIEEALPIAKQIAEALEAAHEQGIIHRDLKPANIKVRSDGTVKVLDFGLAKALAPVAASPAADDLANSPTTPAMTEAGMILGTAAYMSPEQARGNTVDKRTDIWAFGAVLFEMLTGQPAFRGETITDILAAVVRSEPNFSRVPERARRLLRSCLEKNPRRRLQAIGDAWLLLDEAAPEPRSSRKGRIVPWLAATAIAVIAVAALLATRRPRVVEERSVQFQVSPPPGARFQQGVFSGAAVSPDGRAIAFVGGSGRSSLWVRRLDSVTARELPGTTGATFPFWAPDGQALGFFADRKLKKVDLSGNPPVIISDVPDGRGGSWGADGTIVFSQTAGGLRQVTASGGVPRPVTSPDLANGESTNSWPQVLPDGRHVLYWVRSSKPNRTGIYLSPLDHPDEKVFVVESASAGAYAPARGGGLGHLLWVRDNALTAQSFDPLTAQLSGVPVAIPGVEVGTVSALGWASFSVSHEGTLMSSGADDRYQLAWLNRDGRVLTSVGTPGRYTAIRMSPDGGRAAVSLAESSGQRDIWEMDLARGLPDRLTRDGGNVPVWSPDGGQIAYHDTTLTRLWTMGAAGDHRRTLLESKSLVYINDWSPDSAFVMYTAASTTTLWDLWLLPTMGDPTPVPVLVTPSSESHGQFSPDGRWIAYTSDESGQEEIYVRSRTGPGSTRVSTGGGSFSRWRKDGKELFYRSLDGNLTAVSVASAGDRLQFATPTPLFPIVEPLGTFAYPYDVTPDGQKILALTPSTKEQGLAPLTVTLNWEASLGK